MPYIVNGNHITTPVSIYDVQRCLGSGSPDLATLCMRQNINMWSVSKPVYMAKMQQLTDGDLKTGRVISGYSTSYGIKKRKSNVWGDFIDIASSQNYGSIKSEVWQYDHAVLDGVNYFRLTDFYNYWHEAVCAMIISLDGKTNVVVPSAQGGTGDVLKYTLNFKYWLYDVGSMTPQQMFGACANYYPTVILTCYYSGGAYRYAKSSLKEGTSDQYWTIGEIGANSSQSGASINIDMAEVAQVMVQQQGARYGYDCFINGRQWSACIVLTNVPLAGTTSSWEPSGKDIVRLEFAAGVDRNTFQITSGKYSYISAMSIAVTLKRDTSNTSWYYIDSIEVTATKVTADAMTFGINAQLSCVIGTVGMSGVAPDAQSINVSMNSTTFAAQTGSVTNTLQFNKVTYKPTGDADPSGSRFCTGTLTFHDQSNRGDWIGSFTIDVKTGSVQYYRTVALS